MSEASGLLSIIVPHATTNKVLNPSAETGGLLSVLASPPAITPTLGVTELVTNGDFETGSPPTGWLTSSASVASDADKHGGAAAAKVTATAGGGGIYRAITLVNGTWYKLNGWHKVAAGDLGRVDLTLTGTWVTMVNTPAAQRGSTIYTNTIGSGRAGGTAYWIAAWMTTNTDIGYFDDFSVKAITFATMFGSLVNSGYSDIVARVILSAVGTATQSGVAICMNSATAPTDLVHAYYNSWDGKCYLDKCVGGVSSTLTSGAVVWGAGKYIEIRKSGTTVTLYYDGAVVGAPQTVTDGTIVNNTIHGLFSTDAANTFANFSLTLPALGAALVTTDDTVSLFGFYSYKCVTSAALADGLQLTLAALTNADHYATVHIRGTIPTTMEWSLNAGGNWRAPTKLRDCGGGWELWGYPFLAADANASVSLRVRQGSNTARTFYIDAVQVELGTHWTSYCDGDQAGCVWNGTVHGSYSYRGADTRYGGQVFDLFDTSEFEYVSLAGFGMTPVTHQTQAQPLLERSAVLGIRRQPRVMTITGTVSGATTLSHLQDLREALIDAVRPDATPTLQPIILQWAANARILECFCFYDSGLQGFLSGLVDYDEELALRFVDYEGCWYEYGEQAAALDTSDSIAALDYIAKRESGIWSALAGMTGAVYCIAVGPDGTIYAGGDFLNAGGVAAADMVAKWNGTAWVAVGSALTAPVYAIGFAPDGTLYIGGSFDNAGGDASADHLAKWGGADWVAVGGTIVNDSVYVIKWSPAGVLHIGGNFTNAGGVAAADYCAKWSGADWTNVGASALTGGPVHCMTWLLDGTLVIGGQFTNAGGDANADYVARLVGTDWTSLCATALVGPEVRGLAVGPDGMLYIAKQSTNRVIRWNGTSYTTLGAGGPDGTCYALAFGEDGNLYVGGNFTTSEGGVLQTRYIARWNGSSWGLLDLDLPGVASVMAIVADRTKMLIGTISAGAATASGQATATNGGSQPAFPVVVIKRTGGTSATLEWLANATRGLEMPLNYPLSNGETLTIDLRPGQRAITSDYFGNRIGQALLAGSDFASWRLEPGANVITSYVLPVGAPTITAHMRWRARHWSHDGVMR